MSLPRCCNGKKIHPPVQERWVWSLGGEIPWSRKWQPTLLFLPGESHGQRSLMGYSPWSHKELDMTDWAHTAQDTWPDDSMYIYIVKWLPKSGELTHASHHKVTWILKISSLGRFQVYNTPVLTIGEGNGTPLQYSCLENPMDRGAWWAAVHGVAEGWTRLSDFTFTFHFPALEKEMATHSSVLAWRILGTGEPGGLPSMGLHRVGHDWSNLAAAAAVLTIATMLCIWSVSPHLLHPSTHQPQFYSLSSTFLSFYRQMRSYGIFLSLPGSFHLA